MVLQLCAASQSSNQTSSSRSLVWSHIAIRLRTITHVMIVLDYNMCILSSMCALSAQRSRCVCWFLAIADATILIRFWKERLWWCLLMVVRLMGNIRNSQVSLFVRVKKAILFCVLRNQDFGVKAVLRTEFRVQCFILLRCTCDC